MLKSIFRLFCIVVFREWLVEAICKVLEFNEFKIRQKLKDNYPKLFKLWPKTVFDISEDSENPFNSPLYMRRYILFQCSLFRIYFHRFIRSDLDTPHDHPWNFILYQIRGGYKEHLGKEYFPTNNFEHYDERRQLSYNDVFSMPFEHSHIIRKPRDLTIRTRNLIHWVELDRCYENDWYKAPLTVTFSGPRKGKFGEEWGFWRRCNRVGEQIPNVAYRKWTPWKKFQNIKTEKQLEDLTSH